MPDGSYIMLVAPKVMPPIYFYRSYNRCKEHNNTLWLSKLSATGHKSSAQSPPSLMHFHHWYAVSQEPARHTCKNKTKRKKTWPIEVTHCQCHHCWNAPFTTSLCSQPLFGLHWHSQSVNKCQWVPFVFPSGRDSVTHLCFTCTSMSDAILSDSPSATICHMAENIMEYW